VEKEKVVEGKTKQIKEALSKSKMFSNYVF
jgi:hypothetical protein